ncbi:uncharacterized protein BDR25DRAFT_355226 [Lindgomyces ingoldianus]|uniref:Uncharacterized protein n=1 Tax=Lindgomyces ingoldianus TaxID=673940 RepID=A0ACB6QXG1_9PLEO|nr:uncharacterized protein BDR25DRAFT_355226 [Lindgomyces ingoldianus]KAF2470765.1 hypothetical protein BDR25DRAFT_355226 [Lindgomyces ingoldianus]
MFRLEASQAQGGLLLPPPPLRHTAAAPPSLADVDSSSLSPLPAALELAPELEPALKHRIANGQ